PQARYADALERALYNGFLSGISLNGQAYFYVNPLADRGKHRRQSWFACACCPPNVARLLMSLPGYVASTSSEGLWLHLYARSTVSAPLDNGQQLSLTIDTDYPWDGTVRLTVEEAPGGEHSITLRIPGWCTAPQVSAPELSGNSKPQPGSYLTLRREWQRGDVIDLELPMLPQRQVSHPHVLANTGQVAITRGPLVYCLEGIDHPGADVWDIVLPDDAPLTSTPAPALLGGVVVVTAPASARPSAGWGARLYESLDAAPVSPPRPAQITAIPYYAWANRQAGPMRVWLPRRARD
ncbi:MAG: glycoside hydrolase family 127 protein, partial [Chloroflexi bacterium]|nr:glycoside hydrolase family 127 protein [Chloroflexota bacterium]